MAIRMFIGACFLFSMPQAAEAAEPMELPGVQGLHVCAASGLQFSPDGRWLFAAIGDSPTADRIVVWDALTHEKSAELKSPAGDFYCFAVSEIDGQVATGHRDSLYLWDGKGGWNEAVPTELIGNETTRLLQEHANLRSKSRRVHAISFSPDGQNLAWVWEDGKIHLWNLAARKEVDSLPVEVPNTAYGGNLHFVSDSRLLAMGVKSGKNSEIQMWDLKARTKRSLQVPRGGLSSQADVHREEQMLAAIVSEAEAKRGKLPRPTELWLWNLYNGKARRVGRGPLPMMFGPAVSPNANVVAVGLFANNPASRGQILLLDTRTGNKRGVLFMTRRGTCPAHLAFSPDGSYLAACVYFDQAPVQLWRLDTSERDSPSSGS